jgi:hypothetical protein
VQLALNTLHGSVSDELPREHGLRPSVQVTVALSTLLGLDEQPGELSGSGPIPAAVARRIAADETGTWRRLLTDERAHLVDYGRTTYRPPKDLAEHVIARDRTCRYPHCNRQAGTASSSMRSRGKMAARPTPRISTPSAADTTTASMRPAGNQNDNLTAPSNGHHRPAIAIWKSPPPTRSTTQPTRDHESRGRL